MKMTDKTAIRYLKRADCAELTESIRNFPEEERDGQSDIDILRQELDYIVELYEEDGTLLSNDLQESRRIMKETNNGRTMPISMQTLKPRYSPWRVQTAKKTINEYRRLKRISAELRR